MFLSYLIDVSCLCVFTAAFSLFLEFCMQEGNIFQAYGKWISKHEKYEYWLKPIGGCVFCFGTWIYIITSVILSIQSMFSVNIFICTLGIGVNYVLISLINKISQ